MIKSGRKKRVSKKNKLAWRKHTDIKDVDDFLEEQRQSERIGNISEKKDEELFTVDVKACPKLLLSAKERRKLNSLKPPKHLTALENTSAVKDPIVQRNKVKQKKSGRNILEEVINPTSQRHIQANKDRSNYNAKLDKKVSNVRKRNFDKDIWDEQDDTHLKEFTNQEWVSVPLALHHLKNTGRPLVKAPITLREKTTALKAIEKPDPGISYNPTLKDHQKLIEKVLSKEEKIIAEEKHLKRVTTNMFSKVTAEERDFDKMKELKSGMDDDDNEINAKEKLKVKNIDENVYMPINPPVVVKKKGRKARRKQKEQKEIKRKIDEKKLEKRKISDINMLRKLKEQVLAEEENLNEMKKKKKLELRQKKYEPKRLGKLKFQEPDIDYNEPKDIAGNLRNVKTVSSLLVDRFKVFQKRNILPVSVDVGLRKRTKIKRFVRSSHKEIQQSLTKTKSK